MTIKLNDAALKAAMSVAPAGTDVPTIIRQYLSSAMRPIDAGAKVEGRPVLLRSKQLGPHRPFFALGEWSQENKYWHIAWDGSGQQVDWAESAVEAYAPLLAFVDQDPVSD